MKKKFNLIRTIALVMIVIGVATICITSIYHANQYTEHEFQLSEIQDGVYAVYSTVVSSIPAHNYEMITICCNGAIKTIKGNVHINYTNGHPYATYKETNLVNGDEIHIYVPYGTVEYQGATGIGRR